LRKRFSKVLEGHDGHVLGTSFTNKDIIKVFLTPLLGRAIRLRNGGVNYQKKRYNLPPKIRKKIRLRCKSTLHAIIASTIHLENREYLSFRKV